MQPCRFGSVKHGHGAAPRRNHPASGQADRLAAVLLDDLIAYSPVCRFVLAPVGMDLPGNLGGKLVGDALHGIPPRARLPVNILAGKVEDRIDSKTFRWSGRRAPNPFAKGL